MLEKNGGNSLKELESRIDTSDKNTKEQQVEEHKPTDWDDPVVCQLELLLKNSMLTSFSNTVKKVMEHGFDEKVAEQAVFKTYVLDGTVEGAYNVADGALNLLKSAQKFSLQKNPVSEELQGLVDYKILQMVSMVRAVRPTLSVAEAMWCLLVCDFNLLNACVTDKGLSRSSSVLESSEECRAPSQSETPGTSHQNAVIKFDNSMSPALVMTPNAKPEAAVVTKPASQPSAPKPNASASTRSMKESPHALREVKEGKFKAVGGERIQASRGTGMDEKLGVSKKGSSSNCKRDVHRQKAQFDKNYKGRMSKGSAILDKSINPQSGSSVVTAKVSGSMSSTSAGMSAEQKQSNLRSILRDAVSPVEDAVPKSTTESSKLLSSATDPAPAHGIEIYSSDPVNDPSYETMQKYASQNESFLMLLSHKQAREKELQRWTDWANEKVMEVAQRLRGHTEDLKTLRREKEEAEKFNKDKHVIEENTMKRLSEMQNALNVSAGQMGVATVSIRQLGEENIVLKNESETAHVHAMDAEANLQEVSLREREVQKKTRTCKPEKDLLQDEQTDVRQCVVQAGAALEKAKAQYNQSKVQWKQEKNETLSVVKQVDSLRRQREEKESQADADEDSMKQAAAADTQKCLESIKDLEDKMAELRLESNRSRIAALNVGYGGGGGSKGGQGGGGFGAEEEMKRERECVMCMEDERSVVFLPCGHQVLCGKCSAVLEGQGMNNCPSCRRCVAMRIPVTYPSTHP
ncbi:putative E3 ubiquitin-protein ligase RF298 isoform X2 [Andrographis paniculata]|nr:putative E3 ubiquitin-protein ligase RF298 isoform X2 [Andrographis paniculata]